MAALLPAEATDTVTLEVDPGVMLFAAALAMGTGLLFGLFPALHSTRPDLVSTLKGQSGQPSGARSAARFRTSLATAQIALSMALLVSAGLFTRSLFNVSRVDLGLKTDNVIMFRISPELNGYKPEQSRQLFERARGRSSARMPGVIGVTSLDGAAAQRQQLGQQRRGGRLQGGSGHRHELTVQRARDRDTSPRWASRFSPGATSRAADGLTAPKVAIVNEAFAKKFNLGRDAVGKRMGTDGGTERADDGDRRPGAQREVQPT